MQKLALIAIGGNSIIRDNDRVQVADQYDAIKETAKHIADVIESGYNVIVTHGNGPQVGYILRRSEIASEKEGIHFVPLVTCVADTQGAIGYYIQQALNNEFTARNSGRQAATVVTQIKVRGDDPAFAKPAKPIGSFYEKGELPALEEEHPDWVFTEDSGRGYRRVVPSPEPVEIVEEQVISGLISEGVCVIAAGGGGIPVVEGPDRRLEGIDAVIDKDFASALLAGNLGADLLIISTGVDKVCLNFGTPDERELDHITTDEARRYLEEGHFGSGSMLPKIRAVLSFLENGGKKAIITTPENLHRALAGQCGTHISPA